MVSQTLKVKLGSSPEILPFLSVPLSVQSELLVAVTSRLNDAPVVVLEEGHVPQTGLLEVASADEVPKSVGSDEILVILF